VGSSSGNRSELNLDDDGAVSDTTAGQNLFAIGHQLINGCRNATSSDLSIDGNLISGGDVGTGACIGSNSMLDPMLMAPESGDYRPGNAAAQAYGAYAP
jgi:hypothetical protein